jgi:hypothetical protein
MTPYVDSGGFFPDGTLCFQASCISARRAGVTVGLNASGVPNRHGHAQHFGAVHSLTSCALYPTHSKQCILMVNFALATSSAPLRRRRICVTFLVGSAVNAASVGSPYSLSNGSLMMEISSLMESTRPSQTVKSRLRWQKSFLRARNSFSVTFTPQNLHPE